MKYLLLGGQPNTGKTSTIRRLYNYLIKIGYSNIIYNHPFDPDNVVRDPSEDTMTTDFRAVLQKGSSIILINSGSDTQKIIKDFEGFYQRKAEEYNIDVLISSVRDIGNERSWLFSCLGITEDSQDVLEIPLGRVTRRNTINNDNYEDALNWYSNSIDVLIQHILSQNPFNI
ncbi:hypothetical protein [Riemerella columbina]|uniref:hypothetical protein n=1 Tax=Riemerella columbina TaxID=103810 RepID=UPI00037A05AE|nr:hypothetical protein [Riemerella columbina]